MRTSQRNDRLLFWSAYLSEASDLVGTRRDEGFALIIGYALWSCERFSGDASARSCQRCGAPRLEHVRPQAARPCRRFSGRRGEAWCFDCGFARDRHAGYRP